MENDLIKKSTFVGYKFKYHETNPDFLTMEEIQRIASKKITIRCIEQVRDVSYIFEFWLKDKITFSVNYQSSSKWQ